MGEFDYRLTTIAAPPQAFAFLADPRNLPRWVDEVDEVRGDGPYQIVFARAVLPDAVFAATVTVAEPDVRVVIESQHSSAETRDEWTIDPADGGSEIAYAGTYELRGASKLGGPVAQWVGSRKTDRLAADLKARLDEL